MIGSRTLASRVKTDAVLLAVVALAFATLATLVQARRLERLEPRSFDLAIYAQGAWSGSTGEWRSSIQGAPFAGVHFSPLTFSLVPLAGVAGSRTPLLLIAAQGLALGACAPLLFALARPRLGRGIAWGAALLALVQPATWALAVNDFHDVVFGCPLALALALALDRRVSGARLVALALLVAVLAHEVMGFVVVGAAAWAFLDGRRRDAALLAATGAVAFYATNVVILGHLRGQALRVESLYDHWKSLRGIVGFLSSPGPWRETGVLLLWLLGPLAFLSLLRPRALAPAAPLLALHFASARAAQRSIEAHYHAPIVPFVLAALVLALAWLEERFPRKGARAGLAAATVATLVAAALPASPVRAAVADLVAPRAPTDEEALGRALAERIPPDASVLASTDVLHLLVARHGLYGLPGAVRGRKDWSQVPYELPAQLDAVLADELDSATWNPALEDNVPAGHPLAAAVRDRAARWESFVLDRGLGLEASAGSKLLLTRRAGTPAVEAAPIPSGALGELAAGAPLIATVARVEAPVGVGLELTWVARAPGPVAPLYVETTWPGGGRSLRPLLHRCFRSRSWPEGRALVERAALPVRGEAPPWVELRLVRIDAQGGIVPLGEAARFPLGAPRGR